MTPFEQLLRDLTAERHNGGGWRRTTPRMTAGPDPNAEMHRQVLATEYGDYRPSLRLVEGAA